MGSQGWADEALRGNRWARYGIDERPGRPLRLGLLVDDPRKLPRWAAASVRLLIESGLAELALVAIAPPRTAGIAPRVRSRNPAYDLARATIWRTPAAAPVSTSDLVQGVPSITTALEATSGGGFRIGEGSFQQIRDAGLDVLLRFGADGIQGDIAGAATHGVWSLRHGDPRRDRGRPPVFWELLERDPDISVVVERSTERLEDREIVRRALLALEPHSYRGTLDRVYDAGIDLPLQLCRDLVAGRELIDEPPSPPEVRSDARFMEMPGTRAVARVLASTLGAAIGRVIYGAFVLKQWSIGRLDGGPARALTGQLAGASWIKPESRTKILADPMIVPGTQGRIVLCEALDHAVGRGVIDRIELADVDPGAGSAASIAVDRRTVLDIDGLHLSYPAVVGGTDGLVVVPEAAGSGGLLTAVFDQGATTLRSLEQARGLPAIDPTVFPHADRWWLACTELGPTAGSHLWMFHGPTPRGPWTAHGRNPVIIDARSARGAGAPFTSAGILYRPAQDLRAGYGRSVRLMRVRTLTPEAFEEELAVELNADPAGPFPGGLHTLSIDGDAIWIDGYRPIVHPLAGLFRLRARLRGSVVVERESDRGWPA